MRFSRNFSPVFFIAILLNFLSFLSCEKEPIQRRILIEVDSIVEIKTHSALVRGSIIDLGKGITEFGHIWDTTMHLAESRNKSQFYSADIKTFDSYIEDLIPGQTYFIQVYAYDGAEYVYSKVKNFQTLAYSVPLLETGKIVQKSSFEVAIEGQILSLGPGEDPIWQYGHCYDTLPLPTLSSKHTEFPQISSTTDFTSMLDVWPGTDYHVRAYAINQFDTVYGEVIEFSIQDITPSMEIYIDPVRITKDHIILETYIENLHGATISKIGLCWDSLPNPQIEHARDQEIVVQVNAKEEISLSGIQESGIYYMKGYLQTNVGLVYSNEEIFTIP